MSKIKISKDEIIPILSNTEPTDSDRVAYSALRTADLAKLTSNGLPAYPHKFSMKDYVYPGLDKHYKYVPYSISKFIETYESILKPADHLELDAHPDAGIQLIGRIYSIRPSSKKLIFIDLHQEGIKVQIMLNRNLYLNGTSHFDLVSSVIRSGDWVGVAGFPGKTKLGEFTLFVHRIELLSACKQMLPPRVAFVDGHEVSGLQNLETRYRQRYLDLIVNENYQTFIKGARIIKETRRILDDDLGLLEVNTPTLNPTVGGATAKPFITHSNDYDCPMFMRIAPELFLKQLIIGGFTGVYELGKQFRNESNDMTHNSEFTSLEFYIVNHDYNDLIEICEKMLYQIVMKVNGSPIVHYDGKDLDFTPPYKKYDMLTTLESYGIIIPDDLSSDEAMVSLDKQCVELGVECSAPRTTARLLDKLVGHFIEPLCINPTFIIGQPQIMSPLAKWDRNGSQKTERFELFVNAFELANAYTELNDPEYQLKLFKEQSKSKQMGDDEAMPTDYDFIKALETALPPTGGFGMGIDRLTMLLTNNTSIRETIFFPTMRPIKN